MRRAVSLESPDLHFAESLSASLRLAAKRLLVNQGIGTDGAHVDLVFHHVVQFHDVHEAHGDILLKRFASSAVIELHLAVPIVASLFKFVADFRHRRPEKRRRYRLVVKRVRRKPQMELKNLSQVHTGRNTQGGKHHINRRAVREIRHVFNRKNF